MINLVTGLPGAGKTLWTLQKVKALAEAENRKVYYHGIPELTLDWELMKSPEDWINLPPKSIIVIDECQSSFRPRAASVTPPPYIAEFETHRHKGLDFFLLTQHPMLIDSNIRRLAGKHYHVIRFYGFQKSTVHEFQQVRENVDKSTKNSIETHFVFPKDVFNWYKSADAHTIKKRIPMRMVMVVILPIILIAVVWYLSTVITDLLTKPTEMADEITGKATTDNSEQSQTTQKHPNQVSGSLQDVQLYNYFEARTPAIPDFPHTAPIYAGLTAPKDAPYPAACLESKSTGCNCYTQQGTKMIISKQVCMQIVKDGFFVDWKESDNFYKAQNPPTGYGVEPHADSDNTISKVTPTQETNLQPSPI